MRSGPLSPILFKKLILDHDEPISPAFFGGILERLPGIAYQHRFILLGIMLVRREKFLGGVP
jgi:hypothetical protein